MSRTTRPTPTSNHLTTSFLLLAQYGGRAVIPVAEVCRDFFAPLMLDNFLRKASAGDIALPIVRMEASQKGAKGVHITDLANYIDDRREAARCEMEAQFGRLGSGCGRSKRDASGLKESAMAEQSMLDRVAAALSAEDAGQKAPFAYLSAARVAIAAMRRPTTEMLRSGDASRSNGETAGTIYMVMLDEAAREL